jgi:hypothetical protein
VFSTPQGNLCLDLPAQFPDVTADFGGGRAAVADTAPGLKHDADMLYRLSEFGWDWRAGCLETGPVRFGRGRLDSLRQKGLAAYLIIIL